MLILSIFHLGFMEKDQTDSGQLVDQTSASVGPGGGTLSAGRCQIVIPEVALEKEVIITLTARYYGNDATGRITPVLRCEPHGLEFKKSVEIILPTCFFPDEGESVTALARKSKNGIDWRIIKMFDHRMERFFSFSTESFSWLDAISAKLGLRIEKCFTCEVQKPKSIDCNLLYVTYRIVDNIQDSKDNDDSLRKLVQPFIVWPSDDKHITVSFSNENMDIVPRKRCCENLRSTRWKSSCLLKKTTSTSSLFDQKVEIELSTAKRKVFNNHVFITSDHLLTEQSSGKAKPSSKIVDTENSNTTPGQSNKSNKQSRVDSTHCEARSKMNKSPPSKRHAEETDSDKDYGQEHMLSKKPRLTTRQTNKNATQNRFQPEGTCTANTMSSQPGSSSAGAVEKNSTTQGETYGVHFHGPTCNVSFGTNAAIMATDETLRGESSNTAPEQLHKSNNQRRRHLKHCGTLSSQPSSSSATDTVGKNSATQEIVESENSDDSDS